MANTVKADLKKHFLTFLAVFSLINCFFIPEWANFFGDLLSESFLLTPTPLFNAYFALPFTILALSFIVSIALGLASRYHFKTFELGLSLTLLFLLFFPLNFFRERFALFNYYPQLSFFLHRILDPWFTPLPNAIKALSALILIFLVSKRFGSRLITITHWIGLSLSPILLITYLNQIYAFNLSLNRIPRNHKIDPIRESEASQKTKIVWIIFDELDYRLSFGDRPKNINLPELDRLKKGSIFFENAYAPSDYTLHSIPSLLVGEKLDVTQVKQTDLILRESHHQSIIKKWTEFPSIFHKAKELGYTTALIGWYHTYCSIFYHDIDYCRRLPAGRFGYGVDFFDTCKGIINRSLIIDRRLEQSFIYNFQQILSESEKKLHEDQYDFVFLHFTIPHSPWIWDHEKNRLSPRVSREPANYLGNLQLVDKTLGRLRQALEAGNDWKRSIVVVSSDHYWRKSKEYDDKVDYRVPLLINMGDSQSFRFEKPIATAVTKDFLIEVMKKKITGTSEAVAWFSQKTSTFPENTVLTQEVKAQ